MPDPTDRVEELNRGDRRVNPLPADARRRSDRLRHRNQALGALATMVAVILATMDYGEFGDQSAPEAASALNRANLAITARMCVFTDAGC